MTGDSCIIINYLDPDPGKWCRSDDYHVQNRGKQMSISVIMCKILASEWNLRRPLLNRADLADLSCSKLRPENETSDDLSWTELTWQIYHVQSFCLRVKLMTTSPEQSWLDRFIMFKTSAWEWNLWPPLLNRADLTDLSCSKLRPQSKTYDDLSWTELTWRIFSLSPSQLTNYIEQADNILAMCICEH